MTRLRYNSRFLEEFPVFRFPVRY